MYRVIVTLLLSIYVLQADHSNHSYEQTKQIALQNQKTLLIVMKTQYCGWCRRLVNKTMQDPEVKKLLDEKYEVKIIDRDRDRGKYPEEFYVNFVPVTFVINPQTSEVEHEIIGFVTPKELLDHLDGEENVE
jgi:thioredoxin-related protein